MSRDDTKLALPGFRHLVDWRGLPARLEWALAPDRGVGVTKPGPGCHAWPSGVCVAPGCRNLSPRALCVSGRRPLSRPGLWG